MIDSHLHLQDVRLSSDTEEIMATVRTSGIRRLVVNGTEPLDWDAVEKLAADYEEVIAFFGLHPWRVGKETEGWLDDLEARLRRDDNAGVGEIGLDRWIWNSDFTRQKEVFSAQLDLARNLDRPVAVHCLQAWGTLLEVLSDAGSTRRPLLHSYGGPREMIEDFVELGAFFSISGYFFRPEKAEKLAVFDAVPLDRLLIESDAPDMLPPPDRVRFAKGDVNHPANLAAIYEAVASRLAISPDEVVTMMRRNFAAWYGG